MTLPKELTTVTLVSRIAELIVLIAAMIISFGLGVNYQETIDLLKQQNNLTPATINKPQAPIYDPYREPIDSGTSPLSNTIGETANWKTYANKQYGYSFLYPNDATVQEVHSKYVSLRKSGTIGRSVRINFFIFENPENLSEKNFYTTKQYRLSEKESSQSVSFTEVSLGNIKAFRAINTATQATTGNTDYLIKRNGIVYQINTAEYQGKFNGDTIDIVNIGTNPLYNQILSTFQFTE